ncbi:DUF3857 domain-containing protein, partial [bacterium]|nr:DUF3857 domain-containing protein [bacterium]
MTFRRLALLLLVLAAPLAADQMLYLRNGDEYQGAVIGSADGQMRFLIGGEERAFPLGDVQRVEFQRSRDYDDAQTAADLRRASTFFDHVLTPRTEDLARRFPQADYVVLAHHVRLTVDRRGRWSLARLQVWRMLKQSGADVARRALYYFPDRQNVAIRFGLTALPDGTVTRIADTAFKDEALYPDLADYNFRHRLRFNMRGAVPGATLMLSTVLSGKATPLAPIVLDETFWGRRPILERSVKIEGRGKVKTVALNRLTPSGPWREWRVNDAPQLFPEPLMPPLAAFSPRLVAAAPATTWRKIAYAFLARAGGAAALTTQGVPARALFDQVRTSIRLEDVPLSA